MIVPTGPNNCQHPRATVAIGPTTDQRNYHCPDCHYFWTTWPTRLTAAAIPPAHGDGEGDAWHTDDHLTDKSATTYDKAVAERWVAKGWPVTPMYYTRPTPEAKWRCECCATHEVELTLTCHNSSCERYAAEVSVYRGWDAALALPAQGEGG